MNENKLKIIDKVRFSLKPMSYIFFVIKLYMYNNQGSAERFDRGWGGCCTFLTSITNFLLLQTKSLGGGQPPPFYIIYITKKKQQENLI